MGSRERPEYDKPAGSAAAVLALLAPGLCAADLAGDRPAAEQDHNARAGQRPAQEKPKRGDLPAEQPTRYAARPTAVLEPADVCGQRVVCGPAIEQQQRGPVQGDSVPD